MTCAEIQSLLTRLHSPPSCRVPPSAPQALPGVPCVQENLEPYVRGKEVVRDNLEPYVRELLKEELVRENFEPYLRELREELVQQLELYSDEEDQTPVRAKK